MRAVEADRELAWRAERRELLDRVLVAETRVRVLERALRGVIRIAFAGDTSSFGYQRQVVDRARRGLRGER